MGSWTIIALVVGMQNYVSALLAGEPLSFPAAALRHLPLLAVWTAATPLIFQSVRRWPILSASWRKALPLHALIGIAYVVTVNAAWPVLYPALTTGLTLHSWLETTVANITAWLPLALIVYFVIALVGQLIYGPRLSRSDESETRRARDARRTYPERLTIRGLNRSFVIPTEDIVWIEASGDHVVYHLGNKTLKERRRLRDVQRELDPRLFVRVHRSTIAQVACIRETHALGHGDFMIVMDGGARVRLTRSRRKALEAILGRSL